MRILSEKGADLSYNDPYVPMLRLGKNSLESIELSSEAIGSQDCVIILTDHSEYDFKQITATARLLIDTRNATKDLHAFTNHIIKLGAGSKSRVVSEQDGQHESASNGLTPIEAALECSMNSTESPFVKRSTKHSKNFKAI